MAMTLTDNEIKILEMAENEFAQKDKTSLRCPRCNNEIICESVGNSYTIRCKSENCISMTVRGI